MTAKNYGKIDTSFAIFESSAVNSAKIRQHIDSLDSEKKYYLCKWTLQIIDFEKKINNPDIFFWIIETFEGRTVSATPIAVKSKFGIFYKILIATNYYGFYVDLLLPINFAKFNDFLLKNFPYCFAFSISPLHNNSVAETKPTIKRKNTLFTIISKNYFVHILDFEEYWNGRPSKLKHTVTRKTKKINAFNVEYRVTSHPSDNEIDDYWTVYNQSWKKNEPNKDFINWVLKNHSENYTVYLSFIYLDGKPIASQIWLKDSQEYYIFKLAQICEFDNFSPGTLLTHHLLKIFSTDNHITVNFLFGLDNYKEMWMDEVAFVYDLTIYKNNITKKIANLKNKIILKGDVF